MVKHWFRNTLFKERQRNKDSPYNFNNPPSTTLNLEEYERTGQAKVTNLLDSTISSASGSIGGILPTNINDIVQQQVQQQQVQQQVQVQLQQLQEQQQQRPISQPSSITSDTSLHHLQQQQLQLQQLRQDMMNSVIKQEPLDNDHLQQHHHNNLIDHLEHHNTSNSSSNCHQSTIGGGVGGNIGGLSGLSGLSGRLSVGGGSLMSGSGGNGSGVNDLNDHDMNSSQQNLYYNNFETKSESGSSEILSRPQTPNSTFSNINDIINQQIESIPINNITNLGGINSMGPPKKFQINKIFDKNFESNSNSSSSSTSSGKRANRTRFTDYQIKVLQEFFENNSYPKDSDLEYLSKLLLLSPRVIVVWFQVSYILNF